MPGGRPTEYKPEYCQQVARLSKLGLTDSEMSEFFGVSESTFHLWKKEHKEFSESIKIGKRLIDKQVEQKLLQRAMGYEHCEQRLDKDGEAIEVTKHYPPDVKAQQYWLNNRKPKEWRNRHEVKADVTVNESLDKKLADGRQNLRKKLEEKSTDSNKDAD
jgi:hypothetical protein